MFEELKDLQKERLLKLELTCRSNFFAYNKKSKPLKYVVNLLIKEFGVKYENEIWLLVTQAGMTISKKGTACKWTLNKNHYTALRKDGFKFSYLRTRKLLEMCVAKGYISVYLGYYFGGKSVFKGKGEEDGKTTIIHFKEKFIFLFEKEKLIKSMKNVIYGDLVVNRDPDTKKNKTLHGIDNLDEEKSLIERYNKILYETEIKIWDVICFIQYVRIFSGSSKMGGRFYAGIFQTLKSEYRKYITFDDEATVEVDISSTHASILCCREGIVLPHTHKVYECYEGLVGEDSELRSLMKRVFMILLFGDEKRAQGSVCNLILNEGSSNFPSIRYKCLSSYARDLIKRLETHNSFIAKYFYNTGLWKTLQNDDSEICKNILEVFVDKHRPLLCYHDSWVVAESDQTLLESSVSSAWEKVLGTKDNLKLSVK